MPPIVIVGGGVIGLCTAYALHRRGRAVTLLDAGPPERAASHGNAGWIVRPSPVSSAQTSAVSTAPTTSLH